MTPDPRLFVPLSCLPALPVGLPLVWNGDQRGVFLAQIEGAIVCVMGPRLVPCTFAAPDQAFLDFDLTPPNPPNSRVDGLDVGLRLLNGCAEHGRVSYGFMNEYPVGVSLMFYDGDRSYWTCQDFGLGRYVPELRGIGYTDPLALRLAVAAVLRTTTRGGGQ